jgi:NAD(P)-dependent dehydrogenase (short-subunit alcohol dehydrogenase family)
VSNPDDPDRHVAQIKRENGEPDIVFANAGVAKFAPFGTITLAFSVLENIRPMIETAPLEKAVEAYARTMDGKARFRMVLVTGQ